MFKYSKDLKIPIVMLLSGGYMQENGYIIGDSIRNILNKFK